MKKDSVKTILRAALGEADNLDTVMIIAMQKNRQPMAWLSTHNAENVSLLSVLAQNVATAAITESLDPQEESEFTAIDPGFN